MIQFYLRGKKMYAWYRPRGSEALYVGISPIWQTWSWALGNLFSEDDSFLELHLQRYSPLAKPKRSVICMSSWMLAQLFRNFSRRDRGKDILPLLGVRILLLYACPKSHRPHRKTDRMHGLTHASLRTIPTRIICQSIAGVSEKRNCSMSRRVTPKVLSWWKCASSTWTPMRTIF